MAYLAWSPVSHMIPPALQECSWTSELLGVAPKQTTMYIQISSDSFQEGALGSCILILMMSIVSKYIYRIVSFDKLCIPLINLLTLEQLLLAE